jgi:predicted nucleic acid-binding protein
MASRRRRPFLDTNVLFSGLYSPCGAPAAILDLHARGELTIVVSRQVLDELVATMRAKRADLLPALERLLVSAPPEVWPSPAPAEVAAAAACVNPTDAPILAAALASGADCLVTGNTRHFTPEVGRRAGIPIVTPAACLASLSSP